MRNNFHLARFNLRKVKNIIYNFNKIYSRRPYLPQNIFFTVAYIKVHCKFTHSYNCIHRSSYFVTHICKEHRFHSFALKSFAQMTFLNKSRCRRNKHEHNNGSPVRIIRTRHIKNLNQHKRKNKTKRVHRNCYNTVYVQNGRS